MNAIQSNIALVDESLRVGNRREAKSILKSLIDCCPTKIEETLKTALLAIKCGKIAIARDYLTHAWQALQTRKPAPFKTERLCAAGIHDILRITNDGDDSEPPKLCDTSLIQIKDDAGKDFVLLAMELDTVASAWLRLRKKRK